MDISVLDVAAPEAPRLRDSLGALYLRRLLRAPRGRVFMLSFMANAEEADEKGVFDALLVRVDDPELSRLVRVHRDDEVRHALMLRGCLARLGATAEPIPPELRVVERIDRHAGRVADRFVDGATDVMEAYLVLQVIEERGVREFPRIAAAMRPHDPESAAVIDRITRDEERHVKYAKAISSRYAPTEPLRAHTLERFRRAEGRAFAEHSRELITYTARLGIAGASAAERLFWRALA